MLATENCGFLSQIVSVRCCSNQFNYNSVTVTVESHSALFISYYRVVQELPMIEDSLQDKLGGQRIVNYGLPEEEVVAVCKQGGNSFG